MTKKVKNSIGSAFNSKRLLELYDQLISLTDKNGREICEIFLDLPSRKDYPDYYDIIKNPVALETIKSKIQENSYQTVQAMHQDVVLMCSNAKTYNAKGSWVYKDAITLQKHFETLASDDLNKDAHLVEPSQVFQALMALDSDDENSIIIAFEELPDEEEYPDYYEIIKKPISLAEIKVKIDSNEYRSVYDMEEDMVLMVDNAKTFNESGSAIYAAAEELLAKFYEKAQIEPNHEKFQEELAELEHENVIYKVGDFAYFANESDDSKPSIAQIHRFWKNSAGDIMIQANHYLKPEQTVHPAGRKFYLKEVFKWDKFTEHVKADVLSKCIVLFIKDYIRGRPAGWTEKEKEDDVWVCESRYVESGKRIERIKNWRASQPVAIASEDVDLELVYDKPLVLEKVSSPFADEGSAVSTPMLTDEPSNTPKEEDPNYQDGDKPAVVKRKRGRPRKDPALVAQQQQLHQQHQSAKASLRLQQQQLQQQQKQQAAAAASTAQTPNAGMMAQYQQMQMRNYQMYQQQYSNPTMMNWISAFSMQAQAARAMAPPSRTHRVTRSIAAIRSTLPEIVPPATVEKFRGRDGKLSWFAAPPVFIPPRSKPSHSLAYLQYRKSLKDAGKDQVGPNHENSKERSAKRVKISQEQALNNWTKTLNEFSNQMKTDARYLHSQTFVTTQ